MTCPSDCRIRGEHHHVNQVDSPRHPRRNSWLEDELELRRRADFLTVEPAPVDENVHRYSRNHASLEEAVRLRSSMVALWVAIIGIALIAALAAVSAPADSSRPTPTAPPAYVGSQLGDVLAAASSRIRGTATWYCNDGRGGSRPSRCTIGYGPTDLVAAIAPGLGFRKGDDVVVRYRGRSVDVRIVDVCVCVGVIDLTGGAFARLWHGPGRITRGEWARALGAGVLHGSTVEHAGARTTLPPTEAEP